MVKYQDSELNLLFSALADPSRRSLVLTLRSGEATVEQLARPLDLSTPGVMKHLAVLEKSGLVVSEKRGRSRYCRLEAQKLAAAQEWISEVRDFWEGSLNRLVDYLEEDHDGQ